jgi:hypothetical protein
LLTIRVTVRGIIPPFCHCSWLNPTEGARHWPVSDELFLYMAHLSGQASPAHEELSYSRC